MEAETSTKRLRIHQWAEDDKPREKLLNKGRQALSDAELIAIIISSGSREESAVDLSKRILASANNNLNNLGKLEIKSLVKFKGIGEAKAISITAALELGRRTKETEAVIRLRVCSSADAFKEFYALLSDLVHEEFWVLYLNRANEVIGRERISAGGITGTVVDIRMILKTAIDKLCSGIILGHNHPSGNLKPSEQDIKLTRKIKEGAKLFDIALQDHLIIGENNYYSFTDAGIL